MKTLSGFSTLMLLIIFLLGCNGKGSSDKNKEAVNDTIDTAADSIVQYFSSQKLLKEVTFKNGLRNGLTKTFYEGGQLYQTFWYKDDLREDSSGWYYLEGQLFRSTPYKHDTIDGIQRQFYRTGKTRAKIGYSKGLRTTYFQEFNTNGILVKDYPEIVATVKDDYQTSGRYRINLEMSDKSKKVNFYRGEILNGCYDTTRYVAIKTTNGTGILDLKKTGTPTKEYIGVVSVTITNFGNRYLAYKKIDLPYNDLN